MAVDKYVSANLAAGKLEAAGLCNGSKVIAMAQAEEIGAADGDGSVYRFFKGVKGNLIPLELKVYADAALTEIIDCDIGLYEQSYGGVDGVVISADVFANSLDLAADSLQGLVDATPETPADGIFSIDLADRLKTIYEHGGHTVATQKEGYDICLTTNTDAAVGGTILMILTCMQG